MDFLKNISMSTRIVMTTGVVIVGALAVVALQREEPANKAPAAPQLKQATPLSPAPSKENVSKQVQERIEHLRSVVEKNPSDARSAFELARTLQDGHDLPGALKYFEIGLKADSKDVAARVDYSLCLYLSGKEQEAFKQNTIVLWQDGTNAQALYNIGAIHANRGRPDSAAFYWKRLVAVHPEDELARKAEDNLKQLRDAAQM